MPKYLKKFIVWLMVVVNLTVGASPMAYAGLEGVLKDLGANISSASGGRYSSSARNVTTVGGMSMRFPTRGATVTLISITPPTVSVGCGGVSAWFGGFSFVTGKQVEQWIRTMAMGATAYVVKMAIKALCPICEAVLATIEKLAQFAAKLSMDACAAGAALGAMAWDSFGSAAQDKKRPVCGRAVTDSNEAKDLLDGLDTLCSSVDKADTALSKSKDRLYNRNDPAGNIQFGQGNITWLMLRAMKLAGPEAYKPIDDGASATSGGITTIDKRAWHGYLLFNMVGSYSQGDGTTKATCATMGGTPDKSNEAGCYYPATTQPENLWAALLCGDKDGRTPTAFTSSTNSTTGKPLDVVSEKTEANGSKTSQVSPVRLATHMVGQMNAYCDSLPSASPDGMQLWRCLADSGDSGSTGSETTSEYLPLKCTNMEKTTWAELRKNVLANQKDPGYLLYVYDLLLGGVESVIAGTPLKPELVALLDRTSYPVYQLLTVAAVYPDAAISSLSSLSFLIAQGLITEEIQQLARAMSQTGALRTADGQKTTEAITKALTQLKDHNAQIQATLTTEADLQTKLYSQIRDLNRRVQQSVLSPSLLANERMATNLRQKAATLDKRASSSSTTTTPPTE